MKPFLQKIVSTLVKWFQPRHKTEYKEELPEVLNDRTIYIIGSTKPWLIAFKCPCGCDCNVYLNLLEDSNPRWRFSKNSKRRITISPSIWRTQGCESHFFIRKSKVDWVSANSGTNLESNNRITFPLKLGKSYKQKLNS